MRTVFARHTTEVQVMHAEREHGESRYCAMKLINLMFDLVLHDHDAVVAALLPFFNATLTVPRTVGVTLIVLGVVTINLRRSASTATTASRSFPDENQRLR